MSMVSNGGGGGHHNKVTVEQRTYIQQTTAIDQRSFVQQNGNGQQKRFGRASHIMLKLANGNGAMADSTVFTNSGKKPGLEIWRVEKLKLIPVSISEYGKFYMYDAYVILFTATQSDQHLQHFVHFWQGDACSQDEVTVAAYKTVELDTLLGSPLTLSYREVQGHETKQFMSYFKTGLRYIEGSMNVETNREFETGDGLAKRLYKVKGKHNCRATQVDFTIQSLNQNEVFVLDAGWNIYVWIGPTSPRHERLKGAEFASQLRDDEHRGQAYVHVIEQSWENDEQFFAEFGGDGVMVTNANGHTHMIKEMDEHAQQDWQHERKEPEEIKLYKVVDKCGKLDAKDVRTRPMSRKLLDSSDCFVLDLGNGGVFAWVGRQCATVDTIESWKLALEYLRFRGHPKWTPICRVKEGYEPAAFIEAFQVWLDPKSAAAIEFRSRSLDDEECMLDGSKAKDYMPDDGSGEVQIWRVENFYMAPVDKSQYGRFYSNDCYVIMYRYVEHDLEKGVVYFWQGANANPDEKAASAMMAMKVDAKEMNGHAVLVRVIQNKEPIHFLKIFENKMVVLMGGHKSGFKSLNESDCYEADGTRLFQVREGRVIQVPEKASLLNSNDIFILETPRTTFMWHGKTASEEEKKASKDFARRVIPLRNPHMVEEGNEPEEFWQALGGPVANKHSSVNKNLIPQTPQCEHTARLYHVTNSPGYLRVEEVVDFDQRDLFDEDIMILDTFDEVFVWMGQNANENEKKDAIKMAIEFIRTDPYGRQIDNTLVIAVKQSYEWPPFIGHFGGRWQSDMWNYVISYDDLKRQFSDSNGKLAKMADIMKRSEKVFSLEMLMGKEVPEGVDPGRKEFHLSEDEFLRVFQLSRAEYMKLPQWKRLELKKKSGLF